VEELSGCALLLAAMVLLLVPAALLLAVMTLLLPAALLLPPPVLLLELLLDDELELVQPMARTMGMRTMDRFRRRMRTPFGRTSGVTPPECGSRGPREAETTP
jgi:hypothetical protein